MTPSFSRKIIPILSILLPLAAFLAAGVSLYFWQQARPTVAREAGVERPRPRHEATPEEFTSGMDSILVVFFADYGVGKADIKRRQGSMGIRNMFTVNVPSTTSLTLMHLKLGDLARSRGGRVFRGVEGADGQSLAVTLGAGSQPTDVITMKKVPGLKVHQAVMAIVIDDVGLRDTGDIRGLLERDLTLTLSILPFRRFTSEAVKLARETETPFILHMPMEPKGTAEKPGEGAILAGDPDAAIRQKLARAFSVVKGAEGVNNHMGSRATEDRRAMESVVGFMNENGYFVVDSRTSNHSVLFDTAQKNRVKCAAMTGYIDIIGARDSIRLRLNQLADAAGKGGPVIVIGHDRESTIDVLEKELPRLVARGIRLVPVSDVVR